MKQTLIHNKTRLKLIQTGKMFYLVLMQGDIPIL